MSRCHCTEYDECVACRSGIASAEARRDGEADGLDDSRAADRYERGFGW